jgi:hypothetical protein
MVLLMSKIAFFYSWPFLALSYTQILEPDTFKDKMFSTVITGDLQLFEPTNYATSKLWLWPI